MTSLTVRAVPLLLYRYEYYEEVNGARMLIGQPTKSSSHTFSQKELPPGNNTIYVKAYDSEGAEVFASVVIEVSPESPDFSPSQEIFEMDIQQAAGSNDPSLLAKTGKQLGSLVNMASSTVKKAGGKGRRLLQAGASAGGELQPSANQIQEMAKGKVMQLLEALASSATKSLQDLATVRQVRPCGLWLVCQSAVPASSSASLVCALSQ